MGRRVRVASSLLTLAWTACVVLSAAPAAYADCTSIGSISLGSCPSPTPSQTEDAATSESRFAGLINAERAKRGLSRLPVDAYLASIAREHAGRMARAGHPYHNTDPNLRTAETQARLGYPESVKENVGVGPTTQRIHDSFMASSGHRANILDPRARTIGVGVVSSGGSLWVVQDFAVGWAKPRRSSARPTVAAPPPAAAPPAAPPPDSPASRPASARVQDVPPVPTVAVLDLPAVNVGSSGRGESAIAGALGAGCLIAAAGLVRRRSRRTA